MISMHSDRLTGVLFAVVGLGILAYTLANYSIGTPDNMGPGFVPMSVSIVISVIGSIMIVTRPPVDDAAPAVDFSSLLWVAAGLVAFALGVDRIGLVPSIFLLVTISSRAENSLSIPKALGLSAFVSALCYVIFVWVLSLGFSAFSWRF